MPRTCTVCTHPGRHAIDRALAAETASNRRIAARYGVSEQAVRRHRSEHLPATVVQAAEAEDVRHAIDIFRQLRDVNDAVQTVLTRAQETNDGDLVLKASDRILKQLELQARLLDALDDGTTVTVNLNADLMRVELAGVILDELERFPEARIAVAAALDARYRGDAR